MKVWVISLGCTIVLAGTLDEAAAAITGERAHRITTGN